MQYSIVKILSCLYSYEFTFLSPPELSFFLLHWSAFTTTGLEEH
jgi:hypothetical protein